MNCKILTILTCILVEYVVCDIIAYSRETADVLEEFRDLPAHFGPPPPSSGTKYLAVTGEPLNGCKTMKPPPNVTQTISFEWVVIIQRSNCSFEEKVRNAQSSGWDAVIVFNVGSNELEQMSAKNSDGILIPAVFVGERTGHLLMYSYANNDKFGIIINDDLPFNINTHLIIPFSIVVGLCFVTMIGFMVVKCVREQRRLRRYRLPSNLLKKIPMIKFAKGDNYDTCAICLDDYVEGDKLRVLPCSHAYHTKCIDPWLTKNRRVCPICKRKVFARGEQRRRRSSSDSMTDSEDDRTPLLNPVENSSNHGTFDRTGEATTSNSGDATPPPYQPPARFNPFNRLTSGQNENDSEEPTRWQRFVQMFRRNPLVHEVTDVSEPPTSVLVQSTIDPVLSVPTPIAIRRSNNVLNQNLSGSFKDDDVENILTQNQGETSAVQESGAVIAAIPNTNFDPTAPTTARRFNSSNTRFN